VIGEIWGIGGEGGKGANGESGKTGKKRSLCLLFTKNGMVSFSETPRPMVMGRGEKCLVFGCLSKKNQKFEAEKPATNMRVKVAKLPSNL
jgi:hypothetical protein